MNAETEPASDVETRGWYRSAHQRVSTVLSAWLVYPYGLATLTEALQDVTCRAYWAAVAPEDRETVGITGYGGPGVVPVTILTSREYAWPGWGADDSTRGPVDGNAAVADRLLRAVDSAVRELLTQATRLRSPSSCYAGLPRLRLALPAAHATAQLGRVTVGLRAYVVRDADAPAATDSAGGAGLVLTAPGTAADRVVVRDAQGRTIGGITADGRVYNAPGAAGVPAAVDALLALPPEALFYGTTEAREAIDRVRAARAAAGHLRPEPESRGDR